MILCKKLRVWGGGGKEEKVVLTLKGGIYGSQITQLLMQ